jgi:hypothetical protein
MNCVDMNRVCMDTWELSGSKQKRQKVIVIQSPHLQLASAAVTAKMYLHENQQVLTNTLIAAVASQPYIYTRLLMNTIMNE